MKPNTAKITLFCALMFSLTGCFTGVESTPRITYSDVKKEHIQQTEEQKFLSDIIPDAPYKWRPGKKFYVTDSKIALIFTSDQPIDNASLPGMELTFNGFRTINSPIGQSIALIEFVTPKGQKLNYKTDIEYDDLMQRETFDIPFAIDSDLVDTVYAQIKGKTFYITTPLWYDLSGKRSITGLRHVAVHIDDVLPGNSNYPVRIVFSLPDRPTMHSVYMTVGNGRTATRNFDTLFAFENPKNKYPQISDETWDLITHSRVKLGMTRDECRLALGAPKTIGQRPTNAGMVEYWSYTDGVYLLFEDGYLSSYRK